MKDIIKIKDLNFKYRERNVFTNFNLNIKIGEWTSLIGLNGTGKSTLVKIILGLLKGEGIIEVDGIVLNDDNLINIRKRIGVVFSNPTNTFVAETVMDELAFPLENLEYTKPNMKKRIEEISEELNIAHLLEKEPHRLSGGEKQLVALGVALVTKPKILILDEALSMLDMEAKENIINILRGLHKSGITIINVENNLENTIYSDKVVIIGDGKKLIEGYREDVYKQEKILNRLGFNLPFMIDLSTKLRFYGLIDRNIVNIKEMVNELWK